MGFLHEHIILPMSDLLRGEQVHKYLRLLREAELWTDEQMKEFQQRQLRSLLIYAEKEVPYYHDWFFDNGLTSADVNINKLPIVNKEIMRREGVDRFSSIRFPVKKRILTRSGGSTGETFSFY